MLFSYTALIFSSFYSCERMVCSDSSTQKIITRFLKDKQVFESGVSLGQGLPLIESL